MDAVLVFIDGTICDTRHRNHLFGSSKFYSDENILNDSPTKGSVEYMTDLTKRFMIVYIGARPNEYLGITEMWMQKVGFPKGEIYLGKDLEERLNIVLELKHKYRFKAGIGDRWDDNELHLALGCQSFILKEYEPNWDTVERYINS